METLIIDIPESKSALVKQLLIELGVTIKSFKSIDDALTPNALTIKTIKKARKGVGLSKPIKDIQGFIDSL